MGSSPACGPPDRTLRVRRTPRVDPAPRLDRKLRVDRNLGPGCHAGIRPAHVSRPSLRADRRAAGIRRTRSIHRHGCGTDRSADGVLYQRPEGLTGMRAGLAWRLRAESMRYQRPEGLTGMRAGLAWRLRAESMRYQRPLGQPASRDFGPLVLWVLRGRLDDGRTRRRKDHQPLCSDRKSTTPLARS
jgi:hypothetical protein